MERFNFNLVQTGLLALIAAVTAGMLALGCTALPTGTLECSASAWITPKTSGLLISGLIFLKLVVLPILTPGGWFRNLFERKAPVSTSGAAGTVHPNNVNTDRPAIKSNVKGMR